MKILIALLVTVFVSWVITIAVAVGTNLGLKTFFDGRSKNDNIDASEN